MRDGHWLALFFSGRQHAGENLADVLKLRAAELPPPIQMCDALSRNLPGELQTIVGHCLAHARRQFVDIYDRFPEECRHLLETLAVIYGNDAQARKDQLTPAARLQWHQQESQPAMLELHERLKRQLDERLRNLQQFGVLSGSTRSISSVLPVSSLRAGQVWAKGGYSSDFGPGCCANGLMSLKICCSYQACSSTVLPSLLIGTTHRSRRWAFSRNQCESR